MRRVSAETLSVTVPLFRMVETKSLLAFDFCCRTRKIINHHDFIRFSYEAASAFHKASAFAKIGETNETS